MITAATFYGRAEDIAVGSSGYYLSPLSPRFLYATPDATGYIITLPDASVLPLIPGGPVFFIWNAHASHTIRVNDYDGGTVAWVSALKKGRFYLTDTSTQAGTWKAHVA
jgi:hypothetical protein